MEQGRGNQHGKFVNAGLVGIIPQRTERTTVSYTHLDVYKRQLLGKDEGLNNELISKIDENSVSYTHLITLAAHKRMDIIVGALLMLGEASVYNKEMCIRDRFTPAVNVLIDSIQQKLNEISDKLEKRRHFYSIYKHFVDIVIPVSYTHLREG